MEAAAVKEFPLVLDNPLTGERFELRSSARSNGRFRFRWTLAAGKTGPPEHCHRDASESFTLVSGQLEAVLDGESIALKVGERVTVPPGTMHRFKNSGSDPAVVEVDINGTSLEDTLVGNAAYFRGRGKPTLAEGLRIILHDVSMGASRFRSPVVRGVMRFFAAVARLVGLKPFAVPESWDQVH